MDLVGAVELASSLCRRRPVALVCGNPPHIHVSVAWDEDLTASALSLWSDRHRGEVLTAQSLMAFPTTEEGGDGSVVALLVVASGALRNVERRDLFALAAMIGRANVSLLAGLVKRLQDNDPNARRDLLHVLRGYNYNILRTARNLGISRTTLYKYIDHFGILIRRVPQGVRACQGAECE